ncbi:MAG: homocysteine S-methyltransferase [Caldilineaceae bacterium SB0662_bin_9]|uniref:Homocysteine S-methyltransferase n=1 Tax=Caldilineaceae bacterium SB0662_bin_9 TaxID=2605258 RepID=A0A6B1DRC5_9CHLR|nr:homocysteine S-methyltransferase [Caldilineaceae bacterium SB0662_bin_9]
MNCDHWPATGTPWAEILAGRRFLVLDGGLASEIERRGFAIEGDPLWSARPLLDNPELLEDIHLAYALAGADILTTATYQASLPGLAAAGLSVAKSRAVLAEAVQLARQAGARCAQARGIKPPLVAASMGPYGAHLADGSEYTGAYTQDKAALRAFHEERMVVLAEAEADILACESIPSLAEGEVLLELLGTYPHLPCWLSFTCRDALHVSHGETVAACLSMAADLPHVLTGVNCLHPHLVSQLMASLHDSEGSSVQVVYANRGDTWIAGSRSWNTRTGLDNATYAACAAEWVQLGALLIGGCCRTTPSTTARLTSLSVSVA